MRPVSGRRGPWSKTLQDRRLPSPLPTPLGPGAAFTGETKGARKTRQVRTTGENRKGKGTERKKERQRTQGRGQIKIETEES